MYDSCIQTLTIQLSASWSLVDQQTPLSPRGRTSQGFSTCLSTATPIDRWGKHIAGKGSCISDVVQKPRVDVAMAVEEVVALRGRTLQLLGEYVSDGGVAYLRLNSWLIRIASQLPTPSCLTPAMRDCSSSVVQTLYKRFADAFFPLMGSGFGSGGSSSAKGWWATGWPPNGSDANESGAIAKVRMHAGGEAG